jgi:hypothetical protein
VWKALHVKAVHGVYRSGEHRQTALRLSGDPERRRLSVSALGRVDDLPFSTVEDHPSPHTLIHRSDAVFRT